MSDIRTMHWPQDDEPPELTDLHRLEDENRRLLATVERLNADLQSLHAALRCAAKVLAPYARHR